MTVKGVVLSPGCCVCSVGQFAMGSSRTWHDFVYLLLCNECTVELNWQNWKYFKQHSMWFCINCISSLHFNRPCSRLEEYFPFLLLLFLKTHFVCTPQGNLHLCASVHAPYASCVPKIAWAPLPAAPETHTCTHTLTHGLTPPHRPIKWKPLNTDCLTNV